MTRTLKVVGGSAVAGKLTFEHLLHEDDFDHFLGEVGSVNGMYIGALDHIFKHHGQECHVEIEVTVRNVRKAKYPPEPQILITKPGKQGKVQFIAYRGPIEDLADSSIIKDETEDE